jgi:membrane protein DedA with SNARE-associated domain
VFRDLVETIAGYPGLLLFCAVSGIFFPLPEDFPLIYAGVRISEGTWAWGPTLAVAITGVMIRDLFAYGIGWVLGRRLLHAGWLRRLVGESKINWAEELVRSHGASAVLLGRFLIGFRAPIFMVAGATRVPLRLFVLWDILGVLIVVPGVIVLGFAFGDPIADTFFWLMARAREVVVVWVAIGIFSIWWKMRAARDPG